MQCSCGVVNVPSAKFCSACGSGFKVSLSQPSSSCPACHASLNGSSKFCGKCGHKIGAAPATNPPASQPRPSTDTAFLQSRKKLVVLTTAGAIVVSLGIAGWYGYKKTEPESAITETASPTPAADDAPSIPGSTPETSPYIGKIVREGSQVGKDYVGKVAQQGQFNVLTVWDEDGASKMVLVTDASNKVIEAKSVSQADRHLVSGADSCFRNSQPYPGVFALATLNTPSTPTALWALNNQGKLIEQSTTGIQCVAYLDDDSEDVEVPSQPLPTPEPVVTPKKVQPSSIKTVPAKTYSQKQAPVQSAPTSPITEVEEPQPTQITTEQHNQTTTPSEETSQKKSNTLNDLFGKLGESIKQGATERTCSDAERSLGRCN